MSTFPQLQDFQIVTNEHGQIYASMLLGNTTSEAIRSVFDLKDGVSDSLMFTEEHQLTEESRTSMETLHYHLNESLRQLVYDEFMVQDDVEVKDRTTVSQEYAGRKNENELVQLFAQISALRLSGDHVKADELSDTAYALFQ